jgi:hypothetical protein
MVRARQRVRAKRGPMINSDTLLTTSANAYVALQKDRAPVTAPVTGRIDSPPVD